jgi:DNA-binding MarR family transcriptional regulator
VPRVLAESFCEACQGRLALTAPDFKFEADGSVGRACAAAADGRRAARALGQWCERFVLTEPEFQVLWCLRDEASSGFDQTTLARRLAYSTAQVSATVEKLRVRGWIAQQSAGGDRRRNWWHLSVEGKGVVTAMLQASHELQWQAESVSERSAAAPKREAA